MSAPPSAGRSARKEGSGAGAAAAAGAASKPAKKGAATVKKSVLAEQERLVQEAELAAQLEAARIEAEKRKEAEAAARIKEDARLAAEEESERLHAQQAKDREGEIVRTNDLGILEAQVYERTSWDKYLECNPLPDVTQESSLNTYLSMWREEDDHNSPSVRYKSLIDSCSTTERVVDLLEEVNGDAREELHLRKHAWCAAFVHLLRNMTTLKLDTLTAQFLSRYDEFENHETRVMNVAHNTPDIAFGLWVHNTASKRADGASVRVKRIEFPSIGFNIELPAALQKSRTSIRVIRTLYDHTSVAHWDSPSGLHGAAGHSNPNSLASKLRRATLAPIGSHNELSGNAAAVEPPEMPPPENSLADISKQADELYAASLAAHAEQASATAASLGGHTPPVHFVSVGGIISIEQLALPPPPKKAKGWVMRDITNLNNSIQVVPYPAASDDGSNQSPSAAAAAGAGALAGTTSQAPLRVSFMLPAYVFLDDREPHFGWWDTRHGCWRQEGVSLTSYEPRAEGGLVHLSLTLLKPVAIIQPRALDFPYRAWHLKCVHTASSLAAQGRQPDPTLAHVYELALQGSRFAVNLELAADHARLTAPVSPILDELNTQQMLPGILLNRMARAGINIQPSIEDAAYCRKPLKSLLLTAALHEHLALVAGVFDLSGSSFNSSRTQRKCFVRVKLAKDSLLLAMAKEKRQRLDEEQRIAAEEARKQAEAAAGVAQGSGAPASGNAEADRMAAMMAAMDDDANEDAKAAAEAKAAQEARAADAARAAEADAPTPEQLAQARSKRLALADEWFTVLVELATVEPPPVKPKITVQLFKQDRREPADDDASLSATPATSRPATARQPTQEEKEAEEATAAAVAAAAAAAAPPAGTVRESAPGGQQLLKFTLVHGSDFNGCASEQPLPDCVSHYSLRRCLLAYFMHLTELDLATALDMQLERRPPVPPSLRFLRQRPPASASVLSPSSSPQASPTTAQAAAHAAAMLTQDLPAAPTAEESLPHPSFLQADLATLQIQQTLRRMLNLTNVFTFH